MLLLEINRLELELSGKQNILTQGTNITIDENNIISSSGGITQSQLDTKQETITISTNLSLNTLTAENLITADEYVVTSLTPNLNANVTSKFYVDRALDGKQETITDGNLTIEMTSGLQAELSGKQATITTSTNLECKSLITRLLEVDTTRFFDTIVSRRPTGITGAVGDFF